MTREQDRLAHLAFTRLFRSESLYREQYASRWLQASVEFLRNILPPSDEATRSCRALERRVGHHPPVWHEGRTGRGIIVFDVPATKGNSYVVSHVPFDGCAPLEESLRPDLNQVLGCEGRPVLIAREWLSLGFLDEGKRKREERRIEHARREMERYGADPFDV